MKQLRRRCRRYTMKFTQDEFTLDEGEISELCRKRDIFRKETKTRKVLHIVVSASGSRSRINSSEIQAQISLDSLFD